MIGQDDSERDGNIRYKLTMRASSTDPDYAGRIADIELVNVDNESIFSNDFESLAP